MAVMFMRGNKRELLDQLNVPYGWLLVEGAGAVLVIGMKQAKGLLREGVEKELCSADEAKVAEDVMTSAGVLKDASAVVKKVRQFKLPSDFSPTYNFKVCTDCALPLPHGYIRDLGGNIVARNQAICCITDGMETCINGMKQGALGVLDAINICQQMVEADLSFDEDGVQQRYAALPEETRRKYEEARSRPRIQVINMDDLMRGGHRQSSSDLLAAILGERGKK